jgi:hypothetical protein
MRRLKPLPALWLMALLAAPAIAFLFGARQPLLQNREKQSFPSINRSSVQDRGTFERLNTALLDRLPLRQAALELHAGISVDVFRQSPNPDVAIASDGYLHYTHELAPCRPGGEPISDPAEVVDVLSRTFVAAGYRTAVTIAGAKQFVHEANARRFDDELWACTRAIERSIDAQLAKTPGAIPLNDLLREQEERGLQTFLKTDTHWNWRGREIFARHVLDAIRPGYAKEAGVNATRPMRFPGNLTMMMGLDRTEPDRVVAAHRTPPDPPAPGEVVLIGDSQLGVSLLGMLDTVLPGQQVCDWLRMMAGECDQQIRDARAFVFEKVSRDIGSITLNCWRPVAIAAERLPRGEIGHWELPDAPSANSVLRGALRMPETGAVRVRVRPAGGDVTARTRLLRLPLRSLPAASGTAVVQMAQEADGAQAPCSTPHASRRGEALILPVPAKRSAADFVVLLQGPPGTVFGPPQELSLDINARLAGGAQAESR